MGAAEVTSGGGGRERPRPIANPRAASPKPSAGTLGCGAFPLDPLLEQGATCSLRIRFIADEMGGGTGPVATAGVPIDPGCC